LSIKNSLPLSVQVRAFVHSLVDQSLDNWYTRQYDNYQVMALSLFSLFLCFLPLSLFSLFLNFLSLSLPLALSLSAPTFLPISTFVYLYLSISLSLYLSISLYLAHTHTRLRSEPPRVFSLPVDQSAGCLVPTLLALVVSLSKPWSRIQLWFSQLLRLTKQFTEQLTKKLAFFSEPRAGGS